MNIISYLIMLIFLGFTGRLLSLKARKIRKARRLGLSHLIFEFQLRLFQGLEVHSTNLNVVMTIAIHSLTFNETSSMSRMRKQHIKT